MAGTVVEFTFQVEVDLSDPQAVRAEIDRLMASEDFSHILAMARQDREKFFGGGAESGDDAERAHHELAFTATTTVGPSGGVGGSAGRVA
jgi:hypothetical protein